MAACGMPRERESRRITGLRGHSRHQAGQPVHNLGGVAESPRPADMGLADPAELGPHPIPFSGQGS